MRLFNKSKQLLLAHDLVEAKTLQQKVKGLLGTNKPHAMIFKTRWGIHTFGMKYPIDVIILDNNYVVQKIQSGLTPNRMFIWNPQYEIVIELPTDSIKKSKTNIQDTLEIKMI